MLAIISALAATITVQQSQFNSSTLITDTAYTVALSVRQAQTFGLSSSAAGSSNNAGYGISFGQSPTYYTQFADTIPAVGSESDLLYCPHPAADIGKPTERPGNCFYDPPGEKLRQYNFTNGYKITNIWYNSTGVWSSFNPAGTWSLDVLFERPNLSTVFTLSNGGSHLSMSGAVIDITSPAGNLRCVVITQLGEVYVANTNAECNP